jgi:soluble lytic murein transglycosylase-like protein
MNRNLLLLAAIALGVIAMTGFVAWRIPERGQKYAELFQRSEYNYGIPRFLLAKQAEQESNYDPNAESHAGAQGIMQIVPRWHPGVNPFNVNEAIPYAAKFMRDLYDRFGSWQKALAAYNAGPTALQRRIDTHGDNWLVHMPRETRDYVARITRDVNVV